MTNPQGSSSGSCRLVCSGSWYIDAYNHTVSYRYNHYQSDAENDNSFRLVKTLSE